MVKKLDIPYPVDYVMQVLENCGYKAYLVGGAVRNVIFNIFHDTNHPIKDYDIATSARPEIVKTLFDKVIATGEKHGTVTVIQDGMAIEVTTFRTDGEYSDSRRPDDVIFVDDIKEDLARRDFSMNAIAISRDFSIVDHFHGISDICNKRIQTVGNSWDRFEEDPLRIMRAIRFACQLDCDISMSTIDGLFACSSLIQNISIERVRDELCKILVSDNPQRGLRYLNRIGVLTHILPELQSCVLFDQKNPHHDKDVFEHILDVVSKTDKNLILRLSALFHDIAKPTTFTLGEDGIGHYYSHHIKGYDMTLEIMRRLKFDNNTTDRVANLVKEHMTYFKECGKGAIKRLINRMTYEDLPLLFQLQRADTLSHVIGEYTEDRLAMIDNAEIMSNVIIIESDALSLKDLAINGHDLMREFNITAGKNIGVILGALLELVLDNNELNNKEKLLELAGKMIENLTDACTL